MWPEDNTRGLSSTNMSTRVNRVNPFLRCCLQFSSKRKNISISQLKLMWYKIDLVLKQAASGVLACAWLDTSMIFTGGYLGILGGAARGAM